MVWLLPLDLALLTLLWRRRGWGSTWEQSYLGATLTLGSGLAWLTEALSLGRALTPGVAVGVLLALLVGLGAALWATRAASTERGAGAAASPTPSRAELALAWALPAVVLAVTGGIALAAPPNNVDSWTYHLARVIHWAQDRSIAPYPTHILRQIYQLPWAEEVMLWLRLLSGDDRWAALVQWWAFGSLLVAVVGLTRRLAPQVRLVWPLWLAASLPMAILQASSTQNDLVVSLWVTLLAYAVLAYRETNRPLWALSAALAVGLALRTKGTAYMWAFPLGVWWLVLMVRRRAWRWIGIAALLAGSLVVGPWYRNVQVFGHPLGSPSVRSFYTVQRFSLRGWVSNTLRHMASHATEGHPLHLDRAVESGVVWLHRHVLHMDPADPAITEAGHEFRVEGSLYPSEDEEGNFVHLLLVVVATAGLLFARDPQVALLRRYAGVTWAGWALFTLLIRWHPWVVRLHLPWFFLTVPLAAWLMHRLTARHSARMVAGLALVAILVPQPLFANRTRPLVGRYALQARTPTEVMFRPILSERKGYWGAIETLATTSCDQVGLYITENGLEYLFWHFLHPTKPGLRLEHVLVDNPTARFAADWPPFDPCALVVIRPDFVAVDTWEVLGHRYRQAFAAPDANLYVYLRESP